MRSLDKEILPHKKVPIGYGPEDLTYAESNGRPCLITGTGDRWVLGWGKRTSGTLKRVFLDDPDPKAAPLQIEGSGDPFHPVGLYSRVLDSEWYIYVINAPKSHPTAIETYRMHGDRLVCISSKEGGKHLDDANSLAVTADSRAYVSKFEAGIRRQPNHSHFNFTHNLESKADLFMLKLDDPEGKWTQIASGISGANGLCLSEDDHVLYMSCYYASSILRMPLDAASGAVLANEVTSVEIPNNDLPDNITRCQDGTYIAAAQTNLRSTIGELLFKSPQSAPANLYTWKEGDSKGAHLLHIGKGYEFPAASTAYQHGSQLYISQIVGPELLVINPPRNSPH